MRYALLAAALIAGFASAAQACGKDLRIDNAWVRPTMAGKDMTVAFFDVTNEGEEAHKLLSISLLDAVAEMHATVEENGVFRMRHLPEVEIPAGETVRFQPQSLHIMIMNQKAPLKEGDTTTLTLHCETGSVAFSVPVRAKP